MVDAREYPPERVERQTTRRRARRVATASIPGKGLSLVVVVDRIRASADQQDVPRYFLEAQGTPEVGDLPGLRWAHPTTDGEIAAATFDGRLQLLLPKSPGDPTAGLRLRSEKDLTKLRPKPTAPPPKALAGLGRGRRHSTT
jgi:hypothetical protein